MCVCISMSVAPILQYAQFWRKTQGTTVAQRRGRVRGIGSKMAGPRGHENWTGGKILRSSFLEHRLRKWQSWPLKCQSFLSLSPSGSLGAESLLSPWPEQLIFTISFFVTDRRLRNRNTEKPLYSLRRSKGARESCLLVEMDYRVAVSSELGILGRGRSKKEKLR